MSESKRKGMWMGGTVPFGYQVKDRKLEIVEGEAKTVRLIFETYAELGTVEALAGHLAERGIQKTRDRKGEVLRFSRAALYHMLNNPLYIGRINHKGQTYDGLHQPIIDPALWAKVQQQIADNSNNRTSGSRSKHPSLLVGKIETQDGQMLTPTHAVKRGVRYRYYANFRAASKSRAIADGQSSLPIIHIPAAAIERLVIDRFQELLRSQTELAELLQPLNLSASRLREVVQKAQETADAWNNKSAADQRGILQTTLRKIRLLNDHVELQFSRRGLLQIILGQIELTASQEGVCIEPRSANPEEDCICIRTANSLEPSGNGLRLIINDANLPAPNVQLAALLGEAFALRETLLNSPHDSIEAMSKALQLGKGYVTSRIRLTFLSPRLVKRVLNGDVPSALSPTKLLEASKDLPIKWVEQDRYFAALAR